MAEFVAPHDLPELVLGGGLGVAYVAGERAPTITEWADAVLDACRDAGVDVHDQRRAGPVDRRRGGGHAVHGRHDQADPRRAHVRGRRRRDERQPAPGAVRQRLRGVPAAGPDGRSAVPGAESSASTASPATSCCSTHACPPTSRSTTCSRCRSPGRTDTRWGRTTTRCPGRRWCSSRTADAAGRATRDVRRPARYRPRLTNCPGVRTDTRSPRP